MRLDKSSNRTAHPTRGSVQAPSPPAQMLPWLFAVGAFRGTCNAGHSMLVSVLFSYSPVQEDRLEQQYYCSTGSVARLCAHCPLKNKKERKKS